MKTEQKQNIALKRAVGMKTEQKQNIVLKRTVAKKTCKTSSKKVCMTIRNNALIQISMYRLNTLMSELIISTGNLFHI